LTAPSLALRAMPGAPTKKPTTGVIGFIEDNWSGSGDLNPGPHAPKAYLKD